MGKRRLRFDSLLERGEFWQLPAPMREGVAPEVHEIRWVPLAEAVWWALSTMVDFGVGHFVNKFQENEFCRLGIQRRDPMFMTGVTLMELESFPDSTALVRHLDSLQGAEAMASEQR